MDQTTDNLRRDIDATRDSMTEKISQIEDKVKGTVDDLKGSVNDTVDQVKQAFDLNQQMSERPWTMVGASVLAGYILGSLGGDDKPSYQYQPSSHYQSGQTMRYYSQGSTPSSSSQSYEPNRDASSSYNYNSSASNASSGQPGFMSDVMDQFRDELDTMKGAAVVTVTNMLRDMLKKNLPQFSEEFERARKEREQQNATGTSASQSYDPLERAVGSDRDATYQTHATSPTTLSGTTGTSSTYTAGSTTGNTTT